MPGKPRILSLFPNLFNKFKKKMTTHVRYSMSNKATLLQYLLQAFGVRSTIGMRAILSHVLSVFDFVFYLQTFGIILTIGMRAMIKRVSVIGANLTVSGALLLGTIVTGNLIFPSNDFRNGLFYMCSQISWAKRILPECSYFIGFIQRVEEKR